MPNQLLFTVTVFYGLVLFLPVAALILWRKPALWLYLLSLFLGLIVGWLDLKVTEVSVSILMLLTFSFFAGFAGPHRAWRWSLLIGIWVPLFALVASSAGVTHPTPTELITSWIALVPTLVGAYAGAIISRAAGQPPVQAMGG